MRISDWSSDVCSSDLFYRALAQNLKGRAQQQVERAIDSSFRGVLDRNHAHIRLARLDRAKNFIEGVAAQARNGMTEMLQRSLFGKRTLRPQRSEEHTSELQSLMRISYAVFCLKKKKKQTQTKTITTHQS